MAFEDFFGEEGNRLFEFGLDRGVFYPKDGESDAQPWMGLTNLKIASDGAKTEPVVVNGFVQAYDVSPGTFKAVLDCFTAPSNFFKVADGIRFLENEAFSATDQGRESFDLSWRTRIGDDIVSDNGDEYKIHLLYDAYASPSARNYSTITAETDLVKFSYDLVAVPQAVDGALPTAHFVIDTRPLHPYLVNQIEQILYSSVGSLPTLDSLMAMASEEPPVVLTNYALNPSFEAAGSEVVVARNLATDPRATSGSSVVWQAGTNTETRYVTSLPVPHPLGIETGIESNATNGRYLGRVYGLGGWREPTMTARALGVYVMVPHAGYAIESHGGFPYTPLEPGVWTWMESPSGIANWASGIRITTVDGGLADLTHRAYLTGAAVGDTTHGFFDGSYSPDPDLTPSWTGTPNASASVLTGVRPNNWVASSANELCIQSDEWASDRSKSARIIPITNTPSLGLSMSLLAFAKNKFIAFRGTIRLERPQTGTLNANARRLYIAQNGPSGPSLVLSPPAPNEAGVTTLTTPVIHVQAEPTYITCVAYNGASVGNGDVWWDNLTILTADTEAELQAQIAALDAVGGYFDGYTDNGKWGYGEWDLNPDASFSHYRSFGPKPKKA